MAEALPPKEVLSPEEMENVRVGYQVAVNLWWYFGDLVWAKFNAMLVVNSVVAAAIGIALTSGQSLVILTVGLSVIGLILCALWFQLVKRGLDYLSCYIASARELEEYLGHPVETVSRGNEFNDHKKVTYRIVGADGKPHTAEMSDWGRVLKTGLASYLVIAAFAVVYVLMLIQALQ